MIRMRRNPPPLPGITVTKHNTLLSRRGAAPQQPSQRAELLNRLRALRTSGLPPARA